MLGREQAGLDQRAQQRNRASGVAARVGDAVGLAHCFGLAGAELGKTVDPARRHAVRGGRVDDAWLGARQGIDHRDRLARRVVVQAQDDQIGLGHQRALGLRVLAALRGDAQQAHLGHQRQTFADLQTGGTGFAVDEHGRHVGLAWTPAKASVLFQE